MAIDLHKIGKILKTGARAALLASEEGSAGEKAFRFFLTSRFSTERDLETSYSNQISKQRKHYPSLAIRDVYRIPSHGINIVGYHYRAKNPSACLIYVHGIKGQADDFIAVGEDYFLSKGYDVFALDISNSGRSSGVGIDSLSIGAVDVANAVKFVQTHINKGRLPLFLFGHSWGGYSVVASTHYQHDVEGVVCLSGFKNPIAEMVGLPSEKSGLPLGMAKEDMIEVAKKYCPDRYDLSAYDAIERNPLIGYFVTIGSLDTTVPIEKSSLYGELRKHPLKNAELHMAKNRSHVDIFFNDSAARAREQYYRYINEFQKSHNSNFAKLKLEEKKEFFERVDIELSSTINEPLFEEIFSFFERSKIHSK